MSDKVLILITAVAVLFSVTDYTFRERQKGYEYVVGKRDFQLNDFEHNSVIVGGWQGENFVITVKVNSADYKLDLKLTLKDGQPSRSSNVRQDRNKEPKRAKTDKYSSCLVNITRPMRNGTCKRPPPGIMNRVYTGCQTSVVTVANWVISGPIWAWNTLVGAFNGITAVADWCWSRMKWLAHMGYNEVAFAIDWFRIKVTWMVTKVYNVVTFAFEWSWVNVKWFAEGAWGGVMWTAHWIWYGFTQLAEMVWYTVWWIGSGIWNKIVWLGNIAARVYNLYLKKPVTYIQTLVVALTGNPVFILVSIIVNVLVIAKLIIRTVKEKRLRRQAQLEREEAEAAEAAAAAVAEARRRRKAALQNMRNRNKKKFPF